MRFKNWLTPIMFIFAILFVLSACGMIQEKPTGLEDSESEQIEKHTTTEHSSGFADEEIDDEEIKEDGSDKKGSDEQKASNDKKQSESKNSEVKKDEKTHHSDQSGSQEKKSSPEKKSDQENKQNENSSSKNSNKSNKDTHKKKEKKDSTKEKEKKQEDPPNEEKENPPPKESKDTIVLSIVVSSDEIISKPIEVEIEKGDNALKVLNDFTKKEGIQRTINNGYVSSIGGVAEKERGSGSGWMYRVNGVFPNIGAGGFKLEDGDVVEWLYTLDLGKDLGAP